MASSETEIYFQVLRRIAAENLVNNKESLATFIGLAGIQFFPGFYGLMTLGATAGARTIFDGVDLGKGVLF